MKTSAPLFRHMSIPVERMGSFTPLFLMGQTFPGQSNFQSGAASYGTVSGFVTYCRATAKLSESLLTSRLDMYGNPPKDPDNSRAKLKRCSNCAADFSCGPADEN